MGKLEQRYIFTGNYKQLKDQTGTEFTENEIKLAFRRYLGTTQP